MTPKALNEFAEKYLHPYVSGIVSVPVSELRDLAYTANHALSDALELMAEAKAAAVTEAVAKERERCCRSICAACQAGNVAILDGKTWWHKYPERTHADYRQPCAAAAIREGK